MPTLCPTHVRRGTVRCLTTYITQLKENRAISSLGMATLEPSYAHQESIATKMTTKQRSLQCLYLAGVSKRIRKAYQDSVTQVRTHSLLTKVKDPLSAKKNQRRLRSAMHMRQGVHRQNQAQARNKEHKDTFAKSPASKSAIAEHTQTNDHLSTRLILQQASRTM